MTIIEHYIYDVFKNYNYRNLNIYCIEPTFNIDIKKVSFTFVYSRTQNSRIIETNFDHFILINLEEYQNNLRRKKLESL